MIIAVKICKSFSTSFTKISSNNLYNQSNYPKNLPLLKKVTYKKNYLLFCFKELMSTSLKNHFNHSC